MKIFFYSVQLQYSQIKEQFHRSNSTPQNLVLMLVIHRESPWLRYYRLHKNILHYNFRFADCFRSFISSTTKKNVHSIWKHLLLFMVFLQ